MDSKKSKRTEMMEKEQKTEPYREINLSGLDYYLQLAAKNNVGQIEMISEFGRKPMDYEQTLAHMRGDCGYSKEFIEQVKNPKLNSLRNPGEVYVSLRPPKQSGLDNFIDWLQDNYDRLIDSAGDYSTHVPIDRILEKAKELLHAERR